MPDGITAAEYDSLRRRVTRLEDERAILDVLHRYGQAIDGHQAEAWADLFTEDGIFLCTDRDGAAILREQGREALTAWARSHAAGETLRMQHCVIAPVIAIDGERAEVVSAYANLMESEDRLSPPVIRFAGQYRDEMVKDARGQWRIRQRISQTGMPLLGPPSGAGAG